MSRSLFVNYSEDACKFECRLLYALNVSGCIPWDFPFPLATDKIRADFPICQSRNSNKNRGLTRFEKAMNSEKALSTCRCLPNCKEIAYKTQANIDRFESV